MTKFGALTVVGILTSIAPAAVAVDTSHVDVVPAAFTVAADAPNDAQPATPPSRKTESDLIERAFKGEPITLKFDPQSCQTHDFGTVSCDVTYDARYDRKTNQWTVSGPQRSDHAIATYTSANADPKPGYVAIWGMVVTFDNSGNLMHLGEKVGSVQLK